MRIWPGFLVILALPVLAAAFGQKSSTPTPALIGYGPPPAAASNNPNNAAAANPNPAANPADDPQVIQQQRLRAYLAAESRKKNAVDTDRLLALAKDLNARSEKPAQASPTLADVKEVEEIEKLAKRVKNRLGAQ
jgi:hypothetical protein